MLLNLFKIETLCLLLCKIYFNLLFSLCLFMGFKLYVVILLERYLIAANLCSRELHESLGMIVFVAIGFLYISRKRLLSFLVMVTSRMLILFYISFSKVKLILGATF